MFYIRYTAILLIIALGEIFLNFSNIYLRAQPEIFFLIAYIVILNTKIKNTVICFFIAGLIADLFTGQHLGVNTFLYVVSGIFLMYFFSAVHEKNLLLQVFFLVMTLFFTLFCKALLQHFAFPGKQLFVSLGNNIFFTLLLAPCCSVILSLSLICPWKKRM